MSNHSQEGTPTISNANSRASSPEITVADVHNVQTDNLNASSRASSPEITTENTHVQGENLYQNHEFQNLSIRLDILAKAMKQQERSYQNMYTEINDFKEYMIDHVRGELENQSQRLQNQTKYLSDMVTKIGNQMDNMYTDFVSSRSNQHKNQPSSCPNLPTKSTNTNNSYIYYNDTNTFVPVERSVSQNETSINQPTSQNTNFRKHT